MTRINNLSVGAFFFLWVAIAQAQTIIAPQFGDQITEISWQAWALVIAYGAVGTIMRLQEAIKSHEVNPRFIDIAAWSLLGMFAAVATFAMCEFVNEVTGKRLPDLVEGALISIGAYNRKKVIEWMTDKLTRMFGGDKKEAR